MTPATGSGSRNGTGLRRSWTRAMVVGELVGFIPPAVTGALLAGLGASDPVLVLGLTVAGLVEGAALGIAQARVLGVHAPTVDRRDWVLATSAAAGFAWLAGMGGAALIDSQVAPPRTLLVVIVPLWIAALLSMGYAQWRVLRRAAPRSSRWIAVTSAAWLLGVMIPVGALSAVPNGWPLGVHAVTAVLGAVAMGLTVGALTAPTLERLLGDVSPGRPQVEDHEASRR